MSRAGAVGLAQGVLAGAVAWWAMDGVLRLLYDREDARVRAREDRARGGVPVLEVAAEHGAGALGVDLPGRDRQAAGTVLQWAVGIGAGVLYAALRGRLPAPGPGRGLAFGAAFSLVVDEGLTPLLGLAPRPRAFPWQTHARGLVGHLVFGTVAETTLALLDRRR